MELMASASQTGFGLYPIAWDGLPAELDQQLSTVVDDRSRVSPLRSAELDALRAYGTQVAQQPGLEEALSALTAVVAGGLVWEAAGGMVACEGCDTARRTTLGMLLAPAKEPELSRVRACAEGAQNRAYQQLSEQLSLCDEGADADLSTALDEAGLDPATLTGGSTLETVPISQVGG